MALIQVIGGAEVHASKRQSMPETTGPRRYFMGVKTKLRRALRLLKALATDERIPRPVRWLIGISLAIKAVPFPDFGVDEIGLLVAFVLLSTVYRRQFAEIRAELTAEEAAATAEGAPQG